MVICNAKGVILFSSSSFCTQFEIKGKGIKGKSFHLLEFWTENSRKRLALEIASFPRFKKHRVLSFTDYFLNHKQQFTELHFYPNFSDEEKTVEIHFTFPQNKADALLASFFDEHNSPTLNHLNCALFIHGASSDGTPTPFRHFNRHAVNLTGYSPEELLVKTPYDLSSEPLKHQIQHVIQKLFLTGISTFSGNIVHKTGKNIPVEGTTLRIIKNNETLFLSFLNPYNPALDQGDSISLFNGLFSHSFIPICERDYSGVNAYFNHLKQSGVFDLMTYFMTNPEEVKKCVSMVETLQVNQAFIDAMEGDLGNSDYMKHFISRFLEKSYPFFCKVLVHLSEHRTHFELTASLPTVKHKTRDFLIRVVVPPGYETNLKRVLIMLFDLSPTRQLQTSLNHSEKAFHLLTDNLTDLVLRFDPAGRCLFSSPVFELFTGIPCSDIYGKTFSEIDFPESLCRFIEKEIQTVMAARKKTEKSFTFPLKGKETLCSWRFMPEFSEEGEIQSILCLIRDVSFYQNIADYHLMKMEQLELAVKISGICFVEWKEKENRCYFGGAHKEIFGRNMNELKTVKETYPLIHPEDLSNLIAIHDRLWAGEKHISFEFRILCPDGTFRWLKANSFSSFNPASRGNRIISVLTDMTSRKETEEEILVSKERFRQLTESISEIFTLFDLDTQQMIHVSPSFQKITGYSTLNMSGNQILSDVVCKEDHPALLHAVNYILEAKKETHTEVRIKTEQNTILWLRVKMSPVFNPKGRLCRIASLSTDITHLKIKQEQEALHQDKMLQTEKLATLGMLVSSIAHELNNPVNYLLLNTGIISKLWKEAQPVLDEYHSCHPQWSLSRIPYTQTKDMLPDIFSGLEAGAQRINTLVSNLRNFARKDHSDLNQKIELNTIIHSILPFCRDLISKSTSRFLFLQAPDLPPVKGNIQQIEHVVMNLLNNACHALSSKSQKIMIETLSNKNLNYAGVRITDEGSGISPENLKKIKEPFFTTKFHQGMGLGLYIVSSIIENHRGTLDIISTEGKGTEVIFWLPVYHQ